MIIIKMDKELKKKFSLKSHNIKKLDANPKEGYINYEEAKSAMLRLRKNYDWNLKQRGYSFSIMELFWN